MIQEFDNRNKDIKVWINGELLHRDEAKVSVFDSAVQGGDAVWEGIRVYDGRIFCLDKHLNRLMESAKSMDFENIPSITDIKTAIFSTLKEGASGLVLAAETAIGINPIGCVDFLKKSNYHIYSLIPDITFFREATINFGDKTLYVFEDRKKRYIKNDTFLRF